MPAFTEISAVQITGALLVFLAVSNHKQFGDKLVSLISRVLHVRYPAILIHVTLGAVALIFFVDISLLSISYQAS